MKREAAQELANEWYELVEHTGSTGNAYSSLHGVLTSLLPEDVDASAAGPVDGEISVLAIKDQRLFIVRPRSGDAPQAEMQVDSIALVAGDVRVSVTENPREATDANPRGHFRRWVYSWGPGRDVQLLGQPRRFEPWQSGGPDGIELFARLVARRLGWEVPS